MPKPLNYALLLDELYLNKCLKRIQKSVQFGLKIGTWNSFFHGKGHRPAQWDPRNKAKISKA
jgi:hypothetical protein